MRKIGVIPARYKSSRFPGKPLIEIMGVPMVIRVANIVAEALGKENTVIATEDVRIKELVESYNFKAVMTSDDCLTGTDRVWEVAKQIEADIYVNIQGDEPILDPSDILRIVEEKVNFPDYVINGMIDIGVDEDPHNINIPKVLVNKSNELIYMSRLAIPGRKEQSNNYPKYKKQVCIYAFSYNDLKVYGEANSKAEYEKFEDIEILRYFDFNIPVKMVETSRTSLAVDVIEDVANVERYLRENS